jgi:hypothetical protein
MRIRLRGINRVTKGLADGTQRPIGMPGRAGRRCAGEPRTPEFTASHNEVISRKVVPPQGTLLSMLQQYQASEDFRALADSTRRNRVGGSSRE